MPTTASGITFPCEGSPISVNDFATLALTTEAALVATNAAVANVVNLPHMRGNAATTTAFGVEAIMTFPGFSFTAGVTVNTGTGAITIIAPGNYVASVSAGANSSTLTITSQRVAVYVNGVFYVAQKSRGSNPAVTIVTGTVYDTDTLPLVAGDVVTFRYLWTGTGALNPNAIAIVSLSMVGTA